MNSIPFDIDRSLKFNEFLLPIRLSNFCVLVITKAGFTKSIRAFFYLPLSITILVLLQDVLVEDAYLLSMNGSGTIFTSLNLKILFSSIFLFVLI